MKSEIKFRGWSNSTKKMISWDEILNDAKHYFKLQYATNPPRQVMEMLQYLGLHDEDETEIYVGDILEFDNGDRIEIKMEDWLEPFAEAINESDCEDQWRDLYRIERAKIIGNIYEDTEVFKETNSKICDICHGEGYTSQYHSYPCNKCKGNGFN